MVYFMQPVGGGPIKIGFTKDLPTRLRTLEARYSRELAVLATRDGGRPEERELHARFAHLRFGRTEQFRPAPELLEFIGKPLFVSAAEVVEMPALEDRKPMVVQIRGSMEYKAWAEGIATKEGDTLAKLFERALRRFAKEGGYPDPPMR